MAFCREWNELYLKGKHVSEWPWTDVVILVKRHVKKDNFRVLELGCGWGANIPFFLSAGADYYATEGSGVAVDRILDNYPELAGKIRVCDFTKEVPFEDGYFDLVIDRGALTCNHLDDVKNCMGQVYNKLKPDGVFIGVDLVSTECSDFGKGVMGHDEFTYSNTGNGLYPNIGWMHFFDKSQLDEVFGDNHFKISYISHKKEEIKLRDENVVAAAWNVVASKVALAGMTAMNFAECVLDFSLLASPELLELGVLI